jgi:transcriptional regulator GlxA family with amidase domain
MKTFLASLALVLVATGCVAALPALTQSEGSSVATAAHASPTATTDTAFPPAAASEIPPVVRRGRARPLVAIVGENYWTELTDYVVPYGILMASGAADVVTLGTQPGPIRMFPAPVNVQPEATTAAFDTAHPEGADVVIVPAVHRDADPTLLAWVRTQAEHGATVIGVCDGVWVLARAGLLEGRQATGHWYSLDKLRDEYPRTRFVTGRRYVADGNVVTTTGVTATIPVSLALVEAIAGRERAMDVATSLGLPGGWSVAHDNARFRLDWPRRWTIARNATAFWAHEDLGLAVAPDVDEIALALEANAYSVTFKSTAYTVSATKAPLRTRRGLVIVPDRTAAEAAAERLRMLPSPDPQSPLLALDRALRGIASDYGFATADWVALQMEYPIR